MVKENGILDPAGKYLNPLTGEKYRELYTFNPEYQEKHKINDYRYMALTEDPDAKFGGWVELKVYSKAREIIQQIKDNQVLIIESGTGTGKTVILPKLALHALNYEGKVAVTVPKINLAYSNAEYAAKCLDVVLGEEVGFQYRGANIETEGIGENEGISEIKEAKSAKTKLLFSTDGMLRAQLAKDPLIKNFSLIMIDEAHERNANIDILILRIREALEKNDKLKLIVTSATLDMDLFVNYFKEKGLKVATNTVSMGENKPVKLEYHGKGVNRKNVNEKAVDLFFEKIVKPNKLGDTIIFANSEGDGKKICQAISQKNKKIYCLVATAATLGKYKELEDLAKDKDLYKTFFPEIDYERKVIIATDVWESSITLKELIFVIDNGLSLNSGYDGNKMESYLLNSRIAKSQAIQRKGRAGRVFPGFCYRMYEEKDFDEMVQNKPVDIAVNNFTGTLFDLWMKKDGQTLEELVVYIRELLSKPAPENVKSALLTLYALKITVGEGFMNRRTVVSDFGNWVYDNNRSGDVRMTKALYYAKIYECFYDVVLITAILVTSKKGVSDIFESHKEIDKNDLNKYLQRIKRYKNKYGDFFAGKKAIEEYIDTVFRENNNKKAIKTWCYKNYFHSGNCEKIYEAARKLRSFKIPKEDFNPESLNTFKTNEDKIIFCLLKGMYINLAVKRGKAYENLFPNVKTKTIISPLIAEKDSFFTESYNYIIYWDLKQMDSGSKFINCVGVPDYLIDYLTDFERSYLNIK